MFPNAKGSELFSVLATLDPVSQAAGTATTGYRWAETVLTTGLAAGDTVRLKAGFKFYPGCADAQVTLS